MALAAIACWLYSELASAQESCQSLSETVWELERKEAASRHLHDEKMSELKCENKNLESTIDQLNRRQSDLLGQIKEEENVTSRLLRGNWGLAMLVEDLQRKLVDLSQKNDHLERCKKSLSAEVSEKTASLAAAQHLARSAKLNFDCANERLRSENAKLQDCNKELKNGNVEVESDKLRLESALSKMGKDHARVIEQNTKLKKSNLKLESLESDKLKLESSLSKLAKDNARIIEQNSKLKNSKLKLDSLENDKLKLESALTKLGKDNARVIELNTKLKKANKTLRYNGNKLKRSLETLEAEVLVI